MFNTKVKTSKVFIRDASMIDPFALLLFGGDVIVKHDQRKISVDGPWPQKDWVQFDADARVGVLIRELRTAMSVLFSRKVDDPDYQIDTHPVMLAVCTLLRTNGALRE